MALRTIRLPSGQLWRGPETPEVIDPRRHRFPWPADPQRRLDTPYLAVVNARGPWAVWRHGQANPPYIALCLDLLDKGFWRRATDAQRAFAITFWLRAAREDTWGCIWGDPLKLSLDWSVAMEAVQVGVTWLLAEGLACYLTVAEVEAAKAWRPVRANRGGGKGGEQIQEQARQGKQGEQDKQAEPIPAVSQLSSPSVSASQIPQVKGQAEQDKSQPEPSKSQDGPQATPEGQEAVNLPKSDHGAAGGPDRPPGGVRGRPSAERPRSVSGPRGARVTGHRSGAEPARLGDLLGWANPQAVEFGRGMVEAITGHQPPENLLEATEGIRGDVGVWVHYWAQEVEPGLPVERRREFAQRCYRDVAKVRKKRGIRNLGAVARGKPTGKPGIVPGILLAMQRGQ